MFKQNPKYRLVFLVLGTALFVYASVRDFYRFAEKNDGMSLIGGIVFGVMGIIYLADLYTFVKNKKASTEGNE